MVLWETDTFSSVEFALLKSSDAYSSQATGDDMTSRKNRLKLKT